MSVFSLHLPCSLMNINASSGNYDINRVSQQSDTLFKCSKLQECFNCTHYIFFCPSLVNFVTWFLPFGHSFQSFTRLFKKLSSMDCNLCIYSISLINVHIYLTQNRYLLQQISENFIYTTSKKMKLHKNDAVVYIHIISLMRSNRCKNYPFII